MTLLFTLMETLGLCFCLGDTCTQSTMNNEVDTAHLLQEVVITGSREEHPITQTPGSLRVVTPLLLRTTPAHSVDDILSMISGVNTTRSGGISQMHCHVGIRGLSGGEQGRTLVLWDGVPINISDEGSVNWNSIFLHHIQRIEVLKGPSSSLYGNHAMGGVIHIISKKPSSPFSVYASTSYGSLHTWKNALSFSGRLQKTWTWYLSGYLNRSDGFNATPEHLKTAPDYSIPRFVKEKGVRAQFSFTPTSFFQVDASADLYWDKRGEGEKIQAPMGEFRRFDHQRYQVCCSGTQKHVSYRWSSYFQRQNYFKLDERMRGSTYQRFDVQSCREDWGTHLQIRFAGTNHRTTLGGACQNGSVNGGDHYVTSPDRVYNRGTITFVSAFLQDEWSLGKERFWLQWAIRYDRAHFHRGLFEVNGEQVMDFQKYSGRLKSNRWEHVSPQCAFRFNPSEGNSFYCSYSQGFRASILDDLCRSGWMWIGPKIANPDLGPERLNQYEVGGTIRITNALFCTSACYYAQGKDFLYYVATGEKWDGQRDVFRRENVSEVEMKGIEIDLDYRPSSSWHIHLNYTYNSSEIKHFEKNQALHGMMLTYAPKMQWKGSVLWITDRMETTLRGQYKSKQYTTEDNRNFIPAYAVWDLQCARWFFHRMLHVGLQVTNVFDQRHMNTKDLLSVGRVLQIKWTFYLNPY